MQSAVEADLAQLGVLFSIHRRMSPAIETSEMLKEISARLREELDYDLEARHTRLYGIIFQDDPLIRVPEIVPELSTKRLLTMTWLEGRRLLDYTGPPLEERNQIARAMFRAWWYPFSHYGVIHGDPHLGNYTVFEDGEGRAAGINLLDYGCMRTFAPKFIQGVVDLYHGLLQRRPRADRARLRDLGLRRALQRADRHSQYLGELHLRPDARRPGAHHRRPSQPRHVWKARGLQGASGLADKGPVKVPREFVFMDRAAIGLGGVFLHLDAELNYHRLFEDTIAGAELADVAERQRAAFTRSGRAAARGVLAWRR